MIMMKFSKEYEMPCMKIWMLPLGIIFIVAIVHLGYDFTNTSYIQVSAVFPMHVKPHRKSQHALEIKGSKTH